jgi:hypothetical protein
MTRNMEVPPALPAGATARRDCGVSLARLHVLRAVYLLFVATGFFVHPQWLIAPSLTNRGMILGFTGGLWVMSFLGLRYPLQMLPILLFEFVWKTLWLLRFGLPQWLAGRDDPQLSEDLILIGGGPLFALVIPWGYVWRHYVREPAERWR